MKFVMKALVYVLVMNAVLFLGACVFDGDYEFHLICNLVVPVICAWASCEAEKKRAKKLNKA